MRSWVGSKGCPFCVERETFVTKLGEGLKRVWIGFISLIVTSYTSRRESGRERSRSTHHLQHRCSEPLACEEDHPSSGALPDKF